MQKHYHTPGASNDYFWILPSYIGLSPISSESRRNLSKLKQELNLKQQQQQRFLPFSIIDYVCASPLTQGEEEEATFCVTFKIYITQSAREDCGSERGQLKQKSASIYHSVKQAIQMVPLYSTE